MFSSREENVSQMLNDSLPDYNCAYLHEEKNLLHGHWTDEAELYSSCHIRYTIHTSIFLNHLKSILLSERQTKQDDFDIDTATPVTG